MSGQRLAWLDRPCDGCGSRVCACFIPPRQIEEKALRDGEAILDGVLTEIGPPPGWTPSP